MSPTPSENLVLVVDDDRTLCHLIKSWLEKDGYAVHSYNDGESCLAALAHTLPVCICLDLHMSGLGGLETLERIKSRHPRLPVLILTSDTHVESIVTAMRRGAYDYLTKPIDRHDLTNRLRHAVENYRMALELTHLERTVEGRSYPGMVGRAPVMSSLYRQMDRLTASDITVLIQGESGSGKELVARAIHHQSARRGAPFVAVNCAAIPETLQESELFGHEKGSFTGATTRRIGKFEQADKGTLFMDEIAELSLPAQAKLLRVLQEHNFSRVGGTSELNSDFRLIAATHRDLAKRVREGKFREDLYFRVAVFELDVPPLRERREDIPDLAQKFLSDFASSEKRQHPPSLGEAVHGVLLAYDWPGNVRELQNALQRCLVIADDVIEPRHLPPRMLRRLEDEGLAPDPGFTSDAMHDPVELEPATHHGESPADLPVAAAPPPRQPDPARDPVRTLEELERDAIAAALVRADGNLSRVCRDLGIGRTTLYRKLKKYDLR